MYRRAIGLALVLAVGCPGVAMAGSLIARSERTGEVEIEGVGCGVAASTVLPLPASSTDIRVRAPKVGDMALDSQLTEAAVVGAGVRFTAVGAGDFICDPAEDPTPPSTRPWNDKYDYDIAFRERVSARFASGFSRKLKTRPRSVTIRFVATVRKIRWRRFGGRKAVGFGRMVVDSPPGFTCTRRTCPGHGRRFKVLLSRPSRCADFGDAVWYGRVGFFTTKRLMAIPAGGLFASFKPSCGLSEPKPV
ncbi:MAG TPA: hypothetical protein VFX51_06535 [Solirubrobacteraceae bacterium]|nr:hypothetical protein [Solirubrobacteraceae bacterium]